MSVPSSFKRPMYGVLRNLAFIAKRSKSFASTASSHPSPISSRCASSRSSTATYPGLGAPMGYFTRVTRFTPPFASKSPSRKYPNDRRSSENIATIASRSSVNKPFPSYFTSPVASSTEGKKNNTGDTRSTHPVAFPPSYSSWQKFSYPGVDITSRSISRINRSASRLNTEPPSSLSK